MKQKIAKPEENKKNPVGEILSTLGYYDHSEQNQILKDVLAVLFKSRIETFEQANKELDVARMNMEIFEKTVLDAPQRNNSDLKMSRS